MDDWLVQWAAERGFSRDIVSLVDAEWQNCRLRHGDRVDLKADQPRHRRRGDKSLKNVLFRGDDHLDSLSILAWMAALSVSKTAPCFSLIVFSIA